MSLPPAGLAYRALRYVSSAAAGSWRWTDFDVQSRHGGTGARLDSRSYTSAGDHDLALLARRRPHPPALEVLPCRSMSIHLPTGRSCPRCQRSSRPAALDFDYDPQAPAPRQWLTFLDDSMGQRRGIDRLLQEWFGYSLIVDTSQQKMLLLVGPRRSGKGTIGRILTRLVGEANVVGPTTGQPRRALRASAADREVAGNRERRPLCRRCHQHHRRTAAVYLRGRPLTIDTASSSARSRMKLPTRFMFLGQRTATTDRCQPRIGRTISRPASSLAAFTAGRSDAHGAPVATELPGILRWAIEGGTRLQARGKFVQSARVKMRFNISRTSRRRASVHS